MVVDLNQEWRLSGVVSRSTQPSEFRSIRVIRPSFFILLNHVFGASLNKVVSVIPLDVLVVIIRERIYISRPAPRNRQGVLIGIRYIGRW